MSMSVHTFTASADLYNEYLYAVKAEKWPRNDYAGWLENEMAQLRERLQAHKVEQYIQSIHWSESATDDQKTLVSGNIRAFYAWLLGEAAKP